MDLTSGRWFDNNRILWMMRMAFTKMLFRMVKTLLVLTDYFFQVLLVVLLRLLHWSLTLFNILYHSSRFFKFFFKIFFFSFLWFQQLFNLTIHFFLYIFNLLTRFHFDLVQLILELFFLLLDLCSDCLYRLFSLLLNCCYFFFILLGN